MKVLTDQFQSYNAAGHVTSSSGHVPIVVGSADDLQRAIAAMVLADMEEDPQLRVTLATRGVVVTEKPNGFNGVLRHEYRTWNPAGAAEQTQHSNERAAWLARITN